jgi:hypothetical protein
MQEFPQPISNDGCDAGVKMVQLDKDLLFAADRIIDGAIVHDLNEMIIAYKQAVHLHNSAWRGHEKYQHQYELRLRIYICNHRLNQLNAADSDGKIRKSQASK